MPDGKVEKQLKDCETKIVALEKRVAALEGQMHTKVDAPLSELRKHLIEGQSALKVVEDKVQNNVKHFSDFIMPNLILKQLAKGDVDQRERAQYRAALKAELERTILEKSKAESAKTAMEAAEAFLRKADFKRVAAEAAEAAAQRAIVKANFQKIAFEAATLPAKNAGALEQNPGLSALLRGNRPRMRSDGGTVR